MSFWQQNRLYVIVVGAAAVAYLVLWPTLIGEWLAPWRRPVVVRPHRKEHDAVQLELRSLEDKFNSLYPTKGKVMPAVQAAKEATEGNKVLLANYEEMHRWMSFIPRYPFRIPDRRTDKNERQRYVTHAYTYARTGELICDEFEIRDPADGVVWLASTRNVTLGDPYFGMGAMELPEAIGVPETRIIQVALVHELGHLAIRAGVDEITSIAPGEPYAWSAEGIAVARAYPVTAKLKCDLPTLMAFIHALDGAHGVVTDVHEPDIAARAAAPVAPERKPKPAPAGDDPDDEGDGAPAAPAPEASPVKLTVELYGKPSIFRPDHTQGDLKERLTVLRPADDDPHRLTFVANALIRRPLGEDKIEAELEPTSHLCFGPDPKPVASRVRKGDIAATRFFLVRSLKVKSVEADIKKDRDGFPVEVTPPHLEAEVSVAALQFLKLKLPESVDKKAVKSKARRTTRPKRPRL